MNSLGFGSCHLSVVVPLEHPTPFTPSSDPTTTPTCTHFLRGSCRFGTQCRFLHAATIKAPNAESEGHLFVRLLMANQIRSDSVPASPLKTPTFGACKFFQAGQCLRDNCPFPHIPASPTQARAFSDKSARNTSSTLPTKEVETNVGRLCSYIYNSLLIHHPRIRGSSHLGRKPLPFLTLPLTVPFFRPWSQIRKIHTRKQARSEAC
jgi:hypothetical protein